MLRILILLLTTVFPAPAFMPSNTTPTLFFNVHVNGITSISCGNTVTLTVRLFNQTGLAYSTIRTVNVPMIDVEKGYFNVPVKVRLPKLEAGRYAVTVLAKYCNFYAQKTFTIRVVEPMVEEYSTTISGNSLNVSVTINNPLNETLTCFFNALIKSANGSTIDRIVTPEMLLPNSTRTIVLNYDLGKYGKISSVVNVHIAYNVGGVVKNITSLIVPLKIERNVNQPIQVDKNVVLLIIIGSLVIIILKR